MSTALVSLEGVWREYEQGRVSALRDLWLEIRSGEWLTILGPSGCGKTTLLNILCGLDHPTRGQVLFAGVRPRTRNQWADLRARRVGFVFQSFNLIPTLTSLENVQVPMLGVQKGAEARRRRAAELLDLVGLSARLDHLPGQLSGGERQRVAVARGLANRPSLILADEPTGNLDSESAARIMDLLGLLHREQGITLVLVTHNQALAAGRGRWLRFLDGAVVQEGSSGEVPPCAL